VREFHRLFSVPFLIGIIGGFSAIFVRLVIHGSSSVANWLNLFNDKPLFFLIAIPPLFVASSFVIHRFLTDTSNPTIDSVARSIALKKGRLDYKKGLTSVLLTAINIGFGTPVGREGPIAKFGGSFTALFLKAFKVEGASIPLFVTCGVSSALAATFNAPIAAVVFGLEIILGRLNFNVIIPLSVSSAVATVISRYFLGNYPTFYVHKLHYNFLFLLLVPLFALAFSSIVVLFGFVFEMTEKIYENLKINHLLKALTGGIIVAIIVFVFPDAASLGYKQVSQLFAHKFQYDHAFMLAIAKTVGLAITFASGIFGGIFAPSIFIGAFWGFAMGGFLSHTVAGLDPLSVALIGTASVTAGISSAPFRSSLIIIELTQNYQMAIPILLSSVITLYFVHVFEDRVHFARTILQKGFDLMDASYQEKLKRLNITNFIDTDIQTLNRDTRISDVVFDLMNSPSSYFPVVEEGKLIGVLSFRDIRLMYTKEDYTTTTVGELMTPNPSALTLKSNGIDVFEFLSHIDANYIPVVNNEKEKLYVGMLNVNSFTKFVSFVYLKRGDRCVLHDKIP